MTNEDHEWISRQGFDQAMRELDDGLSPIVENMPEGTTEDAISNALADLFGALAGDMRNVWTDDQYLTAAVRFAKELAPSVMPAFNRAIGISN